MKRLIVVALLMAGCNQVEDRSEPPEGFAIVTNAYGYYGFEWYWEKGESWTLVESGIKNRKLAVGRAWDTEDNFRKAKEVSSPYTKERND